MSYFKTEIEKIYNLKLEISKTKKAFEASKKEMVDYHKSIDLKDLSASEADRLLGFAKQSVELQNDLNGFEKDLDAAVEKLTEIMKSIGAERISYDAGKDGQMWGSYIATLEENDELEVTFEGR